MIDHAPPTARGRTGAAARNRRDARYRWPLRADGWAAALAGMAAALAAGAASAAPSDMIAEPLAILQGLDKITARVSEIGAPVGQTVRFGTLAITVRDCEKAPPEDRPEDAAFIQIDEMRPGEVNLRRFSGWMFAQSPALSSLEHPVYDLILLDCKGAPSNASGSPPAAGGKSSGNEAR